MNKHTSFISLALDLEDFFDKPLSDLPEEKKKRYERDFFPPIWDELTPEQRIIVAAQYDYQHDPEKHKESEIEFIQGYSEELQNNKTNISIELREIKRQQQMAVKKTSIRNKKNAQLHRKVSDTELSNIVKTLRSEGIQNHNLVSKTKTRLKKNGIEISEKTIRDRLDKLALKIKRK